MRQHCRSFFALSERKISRSKLLCTLKERCFLQDKAKNAGILAMYSETFQHYIAGNRFFQGCLVLWRTAQIGSFFVFSLFFDKICLFTAISLYGMI